MKGVLLEIPASLLAERRSTGADRWDEMWDGVLHMNPPPTLGHQDFEYEFEYWLRAHWKTSSGGEVYHNTAVARPGCWPTDYRSPDLVLIAPDRLNRLRETHVEGGPTAVIEIRSPGDETYEKLGFYAEIGTAEVWVIHRDTKVPEIYVLGEDGYEPQLADAEGWITSPATGVRLRPRPGGRIELRFGNDERSTTEFPEP
jgi:Uma2 family endonuclease